MKKEYLCEECMNLKKADIDLKDNKMCQIVWCDCFRNFHFFAEMLDENGFPKVTKCNKYQHNAFSAKKNAQFLEEVADESVEIV